MDQPLAYALNGAYLLVWFVLLVHCLRKRAFFPVLGPGRGTRVFWLATFLFFNPILTFFYLLFGVFAPSGARRTGLRTLGTVTLVAATVALFHLPWPTGDDEVRVVGRGAGAESESGAGGSALWFRFGRLITRTRTGTTLGQWSRPGATLATRTVGIFCDGDDPLLASIARAAQGRMAKAPGVETVTCYPAGRFPETGRPVPDIVISLSLPEKSELVLPLARKLTARIRWLVAAADIHPGRGFTSRGHTHPCTTQFRLDGELEVKSSVDLALATRSARYHGFGAQLGGEVGQSIATSLEAMAKAHGVTPALPVALRGPYRAPPDPAALGLEGAEVIFSGPVLLQHARTVWRFPGRGAPGDVIAKLRASLEADGWKAATTCTEHEIQFARDGRSLRVHRLEHADAFVARHDDPLDPEAVIAALDEVLAAETSLAGLTMFHAGYTPEQKRRLSIRLATERPTDALGWFRLAEGWMAMGDKPKAADALRASVVYRECCDVWAEANKVEALAKKLGDENIPRTRPGAAICRAIGFTPVEDNAPPAEREVALGEPVFFTRTRDGPGFFALMVKVRLRKDGTLQARCRMTEQLKGNAWGGQTSTMNRSDAPFAMHLTDGRVLIRTQEIGDGRYRVSATVETTSSP